MSIRVGLLASMGGSFLAQSGYVSNASNQSYLGKPSDWYYKSVHSCTASDGVTAMKCKSETNSWGCSWGSVPSYCDPGDRNRCDDIAARVSVGKPDGFGFMCPHLMLGSSEMVAAAEADGYDGAYGVVTIDSLSCGQCVEVINDDPKTFPLAPNITAQIFNTLASSLDFYMAGGGMGANNGCAAAGGITPMTEMYEKYPNAENDEFNAYLESIGYHHAASIIDQISLYAGGLRGGRTYAECRKAGKGLRHCQPRDNGCDGKASGVCIRDADVACPLAFKGKSDHITQKAIESCKWGFEHDVHWNRPVSYRAVPCPKSLTVLTGLVPSAAMLKNATVGPKVKSTTTTMEDCCEPTCSRLSGTTLFGEQWEDGFDAFYTCNVLGEPYVQINASTNPCSGARRRRTHWHRRRAVRRRRSKQHHTEQDVAVVV